jgi:hypothetical protein
MFNKHRSDLQLLGANRHCHETTDFRDHLYT